MAEGGINNYKYDGTGRLGAADAKAKAGIIAILKARKKNYPTLLKTLESVHDPIYLENKIDATGRTDARIYILRGNYNKAIVQGYIQLYRDLKGDTPGERRQKMLDYLKRMKTLYKSYWYSNFALTEKNFNTIIGKSNKIKAKTWNERLMNTARSVQLKAGAGTKTSKEIISETNKVFDNVDAAVNEAKKAIDNYNLDDIKLPAKNKNNTFMKKLTTYAMSTASSVKDTILSTLGFHESAYKKYEGVMNKINVAFKNLLKARTTMEKLQGKANTSAKYRNYEKRLYTFEMKIGTLHVKFTEKLQKIVDEMNERVTSLEKQLIKTIENKIKFQKLKNFSWEKREEAHQKQIDIKNELETILLKLGTLKALDIKYFTENKSNTSSENNKTLHDLLRTNIAGRAKYVAQQITKVTLQIEQNTYRKIELEQINSEPATRFLIQQRLDDRKTAETPTMNDSNILTEISSLLNDFDKEYKKAVDSIKEVGERKASVEKLYSQMMNDVKTKLGYKNLLESSNSNTTKSNNELKKIVENKAKLEGVVKSKFDKIEKHRASAKKAAEAAKSAIDKIDKTRKAITSLSMRMRRAFPKNIMNKMVNSKNKASSLIFNRVNKKTKNVIQSKKSLMNTNLTALNEKANAAQTVFGTFKTGPGIDALLEGHARGVIIKKLLNMGRKTAKPRLNKEAENKRKLGMAEKYASPLALAAIRAMRT